jgi:hypothetical protein
MINSTNLAKFIGIKLGITHSRLEVTLPYLLMIIREQSIPLFSKYFPLMIDFNIKDTTAYTLPETCSTIRIPTSEYPYHNRIIGVSKVIPANLPIEGRTYYSDMEMDIFNRQFAADLAGGIIVPLTSRFIPPNKIELFPKHVRQTKLFIRLMVEHDPNFFTIPHNLEEQFRELALIDAKEAIYNIRKNFPSINTVFGSIEVDIDSFSGMEDKRKDLIDLWKANYYKGSDRPKIVFS